MKIVAMWAAGESGNNGNMAMAWQRNGSSNMKSMACGNISQRTIMWQRNGGWRMAA
jgi:hypothetical protein